jgi:small neutral amino acid transporter SnatA (MarC family)
MRGENDMTELERKERTEARNRYDIAQLLGFVFVVLVLALGALMMAGAIVKTISNTTILFGATNPAFEFVVGFIIIILAANIMAQNRPRPVEVRR